MSTLKRHGLSREQLHDENLAFVLDRTFLANLSHGEVTRTLHAMDLYLYRPGEILIENDAEGENAHLIATGRVEILRREPPRRELRPIARRGRGSLLGEYALVQSKPTTARVQAIAPVRSLRMPKDSFLQLYHGSGEFRRYVDGLMTLRDAWGDLLNLLLEHPSLGLMARDALEQLLQAGQLRQLKDGEPLVRAGQAELDVFLVVRGCLGIYRSRSSEDEQREAPLSTAPQGTIVGHVAVLLERPRTADVNAIGPCLVLRLNGPLFLLSVREHALVHRLLMQEIALMDLSGAEEAAASAELRALTMMVRGGLPWTLRAGLAYGVGAALRDAGRVIVVDLARGAVARKMGLPVVAGSSCGRPVRRARVPKDEKLEIIWPCRPDEARPLLDALREHVSPRSRKRLVVISGPQEPSSLDPAVLRSLDGAVDVVVHTRVAADRRIPDRRIGQRLFQAVLLSKHGSDQIDSTRATPVVRLPANVSREPPFWEAGGWTRPGSGDDALSRACQRLVRLIRGRSVGLALGGGGAFGFAHIGLLRALAGAGFPIDFVSGVSSGALVGALYAGGGLPALKELVERRRDLLRRVLWGILSTSSVVSFVDGLVDEQRLGGTELPFYAVGLELREGREYVPVSGTLGEAVRASSCMPGFAAPFDDGAQHLVDGGVIDNVPTSAVWRAGADFVLGSNVIPTHLPPFRSKIPWFKPTRNRFDPLARIDATVRSFYRLMSQAGRDRAWLADFLFEPELDEFDVYDFHRGDRIARRGLEEAQRDMPRIERSYKRESMIRF